MAFAICLLPSDVAVPLKSKRPESPESGAANPKQRDRSQ